MAGNESNEYKWWEHGPAAPTVTHVIIWGMLGVGLVMLVYVIGRGSLDSMRAQLGTAAVGKAGAGGAHPLTATTKWGRIPPLMAMLLSRVPTWSRR